jgi:hypothetical protein
MASTRLLCCVVYFPLLGCLLMHRSDVGVHRMFWVNALSHVQLVCALNSVTTV